MIDPGHGVCPRIDPNQLRATGNDRSLNAERSLVDDPDRAVRSDPHRDNGYELARGVGTWLVAVPGLVRVWPDAAASHDLGEARCGCWRDRLHRHKGASICCPRDPIREHIEF